MGYVPLFVSLTTGTLCGRWPDIGLWPIVLSLADRSGVVDVTPDYLARITGLPLADVTACMARFCEPDPSSRSATEEGRRLVLLNPEHRSWGWRVVNHAMYREKARKAAYDAERSADGRNAERMAARRAACGPVETRADATRPATIRSQTQTQTQTQTKEEESEARASARPTRTATRLPEDWALTEERRQVAVKEGIDPDRTFAKFRDYWIAKGGKEARKLDWDATWRNWCRADADRSKGNGTAQPAGVAACTWRPNPADDLSQGGVR